MQMLFESDLSKLWHQLMDAASEADFIGGKRCEDKALVSELEEITRASVARVEGNIVVKSMGIYEAVPNELLHGPVILSSGLANIFYFKSVNVGLLAIPTGLRPPKPNCVFARFSANLNLKDRSEKIQ